MIRLHDTLSRELRPLSAADGERFRFYCCGPTVYGPAHIGNFRTFVINDVLRRVLELDGLTPYYVRNITDVDDKTIRDAIEAGEPRDAFTARWTEKFHEDCATLNLIAPDEEPRAAEHIDLQIELVQKLIDAEHAYVSDDGSVYYRVRSFEDYGKLSHFDIDDLQSQETTSGGSANLADEYAREQVADFALWKARKPADGDNFWSSPWGEGRPGWHLECSAMSMRYLGETMDLHSGGEDLCFPHHENEIAQSEAVTGKPFSRHWFHAVHLLVDGRKMSKSLGNFYTLDDLIEKGHQPAAIRYALISAHYRQHLNLTENGLHAAASALKRLERAAAELLDRAGRQPEELEELHRTTDSADPWGRFAGSWEALCDDLNTAEAIGRLFAVINDLDAATLQPEEARAEASALARLLFALGIRLFADSAPTDSIPEEITALAEQRWQAKQEKNWAEADRLRDEIATAGWQVKDRRDGYDLEKH